MSDAVITATASKPAITAYSTAINPRGSAVSASEVLRYSIIVQPVVWCTGFVLDSGFGQCA
jgi:hypothetical protein